MAHGDFQRLCDQAKQALARGDPTVACQLYQQALALNANSDAAHYGLATAYYLLRAWHSAAAHFEQVVRLQPDKASAYINLGAVLKQLDRFDEAVAALRKGIEIEPTRSEAYHNLGAIYRRTGQADLALAAYQEALRLDSRMYDAHFYLAMIYRDRGDLPAATNHLHKALELRPDWPKAVAALQQLEQTAAVAPTQANEAAVDPPPAEDPAVPAAPDPERLLDPETHGELLQGTHKIAIHLQQRAEEFLNVMRQEMEPALLELSKRLFDRRTTGSAMQDCISKYEAAMAKMRMAQESMRQMSAKVQTVGEHLLQ